jgi:endonuclease/exonuclease/phosphatase (EEP) superfamily protein YafD
MRTIEAFNQWVALALLILTTLASLGRYFKYFELLSHFKTQYFLASTCCLLICLIFRNWSYAAGALLSLWANLSSIAPFYRPRPAVAIQTGETRSLKLLMANVNRLNREQKRFLGCLEKHQPDVIIVQEVTEIWTNALQTLRQQYPFYEALPRDDGSGIALYSRFFFERLPVTLAEADARPSLLLRLDIDGVRVFILSIHPRAPIRRGHFELRNKMMATAAACLESLPGPKICIGDLNTSLWSPYYHGFTTQTKLVNARVGFGLLPSWPTFLGVHWLMIPIDHCLISKDVRVIRAQTGEPIGSDHLPLIVELEIRKPAET